MIKVKILNPTLYRNEPTFRPLFFIKDMLRDYSIDITESDDYDFLFIGMSDFWDMSLTLKDSVDWGLENIKKHTDNGDYFLFDGFDLNEAAEVTVYPQFSDDGGLESERTYVKQLVQKYVSDGSSDDLFNEEEIENSNNTNV